MCPACLGRNEDAEFVGREHSSGWWIQLPSLFFFFFYCKAHLEKCMQAHWFGWAGPVFPYQQKWGNILGKQGANRAVHVSDDRLCMPTGHHHLSLSHWDAFSFFPTVLPWPYSSSHYFQWDSSQSARAKAQFGANLGTKNRKWSQKSKPLPFRFHCQGQIAASMSLQMTAVTDLSPTAWAMSSVCTPILCSRRHCVAYDQFTYISSNPCKGSGDSSGGPIFMMS